MIDAAAIKALSTASAIQEANNCIGDRSESAAVVALPDHFQTHDLEKYLPNRRRARGQMSTGTLAAFAAYFGAHAEEGASVFVDQKTMSATGVLNLGVPDTPGHADNLATYTAIRTAPYNALLAVANGQAQKQSTVAEFLEDWTPHLAALDASGSDLPLPKTIAAVRKLTIEELRKSESSVESLSETRSAFEQVKASGAETLPAGFTFKCKPYKDLEERSFYVRFGILTGDKVPSLVLRITKAEEHAEQMAEELASRVRDEIDAGRDVLLGTYTPRA